MTTTKKLGRPTSNPKSHSKRLRMTDEEVQKLEYCTKQTGKTQTDVLMLGLDKVYQELKKQRIIRHRQTLDYTLSTDLKTGTQIYYHVYPFQST